MTQPTVFISYSHDSPEHADRVLALADRLVQDGIDCILDQYEESPPEGWPKWMDRQIERSDFVLVICTKTYYRRVMGTEEQGKGLGVRWESTLAYQDVYDAGGETTRFIPVLFQSGKVEHIPKPLRGATRYYVDTEQGYEDLYRRLTNQPRTIKPKLGKLRKLPPRKRKQDFFSGEWVYDFFDHFVEADLSDYRQKKHCAIKSDKGLVSGGVAKRGILQHPPLPEEGPSRLPYPPIQIPDHIQELRLDFFIGILDEWPDTGKQQDKFSKDPCKEDAVKFNVRINGKVELDEKLNSVGWVPYSLPIELPTGGELTVEFITDAMSSAIANWAAWGEPRLVGTRAVTKEVVATVSSIPQVSERPTASELRRFLDEDFPRLENALHDVWVSLSGHSPLVKYSATSNWNSITSRFTDIPEEIRAIFDKVVETRELAQGGTSKLTGEQLSSAKQGINRMLKFLHQRFPTAGVDLPSAVTQTTTSQAISERAPSEHQVDFAIITALEKEAKAVVTRLENYSIQRFEDRDIRTYHCGTVPIQGTDRVYHVVVLLPSMGEISAANAATDAITLWNPRFVLMVGIAGGIPQDDLDLGDVVVADQVVGYEYGKVTDHESKPYEIKPRDRVYPASALLLDRVRNFWDESWTQQVNAPRPDNATRAVSKLFIGPIASGNKVIASTEFRQKLTTRWPKLIAVEMEAEGIFAAVFDRPQIRGTLVIRGISDMADERKSDDWQEYAADAAAAFAVGFLKSGPVDPRPVRTPDSPLPPTPKKTIPPAPGKVSLAKLPSTSPDLFGRQKELALLDAAWEDSQTHIVSLVAWGGVGKTALVNKHLLQMGEKDYRGAEQVYGWSFYSQGAREGGQASADPFIATALEWFGDPDPTKGSPWDKGERLAELVKKQPTILILDGLEPLQYPSGEMGGRLKDPGLCCLLRALARHNPGLVIVTTRLPVDDLKEFVGTSVKRIPLEHLSPEAGAEILRAQGVKGEKAELEQAAKDFHGHALALTLLGSLLRDAYDGDVRCRSEVGPLVEETQQGGHARRVMTSYEKWFGEGRELAVLQMLGLFDRPAEGAALAGLRAAPPIPGLTNALFTERPQKGVLAALGRRRLEPLSDRDWKLIVARLRRARLVAEPDPDQPDTLDCHPLVREHFGDKLQESHPAAWKEAHSRLYEYYKSQAPESPDTIEEMAPLYAAVAHGCQAGRHQEALDEVYWKRIERETEFFSRKKLGAIGAGLAALSGFFDPPWRQPVAELTEADKAAVLGWAGFGLRALGRLAEAAEPMQTALEVREAREDWENAARTAGNLSELTLTSGDLTQALAYAQQSVELADRSGDAFERMSDRTTLADALHQAGRLREAEAAFREAEEMQKEWQPQYPLLYSLWGFRYCDLLLGQGKVREVQSRAGQTLEWAKQAAGVTLLDTALIHLSLGRAHLLQAQR
jgi:nucleoside phosphorylase/tetratricopeptide (TPR) repeat protein